MGVQICSTACELAEGCDALVLVTEWNDYRDLEWECVAKRMRNRLILDGRHALDPDKLSRAGLRYISLS
jgi:UDPglucose 6-dehydrogenase